MVDLVGDDRLPEVDRPVDDRLLLFPLEDAGDDALGRDAVSFVVDDGHSQCPQLGQVKGRVGFDALEISRHGHKRSGIPSELLNRFFGMK